MQKKLVSMSDIPDYVGQEVWVSDWLTIDQERINLFADCTNDPQWIHIDEDRAAQESPLGTTIAHGYLTLSLLSHLSQGVIPDDVSQAVNYGVENVRFRAPVVKGARIRNRVELVSAADRRAGRILIRLKNTVEIENEKKPALVGETLALLLP
ncbi:MAG: MaoC family dehydratase [Pseudomonadota bacterium]